MNTEQARFNMIEQQIRPWDVLDKHVLDLLAVVKREDFCPLAHKALAFVDMEVPLGDAAKGQCMLAPRVEARLLQDLALHKHESVLEVGTGWTPSSPHRPAPICKKLASPMSMCARATALRLPLG
jgi:protein-L-isoaspartate(D-aspartate) O-methyltransferase